MFWYLIINEAVFDLERILQCGDTLEIDTNGLFLENGDKVFIFVKDGHNLSLKYIGTVVKDKRKAKIYDYTEFGGDEFGKTGRYAEIKVVSRINQSLSIDKKAFKSSGATIGRMPVNISTMLEELSLL